MQSDRFRPPPAPALLIDQYRADRHFTGACRSLRAGQRTAHVAGVRIAAADIAAVHSHSIVAGGLLEIS
jgi:hypothetical protein